MNLWLAFFTGLTIGGISCLAVQGGLLASVIAARSKEDEVSKKDLFYYSLPVAAFLISKLIAHIILGFGLGFIGQFISLSDTARLVIQFIAGVYMIIIALNLLNVHPIFRYAIIQPPRFITKKIRNKSKSKDIFAPAVLGVLTIFIPCGTTLAMEAFAISNASPLWGAGILGAFVLGTTPLFFGIGYLTAALSNKFRKHFITLAAVIITYLGLVSINGVLVLTNFPITFQKISDLSPIEINLLGEDSNEIYQPEIINGFQVVRVTVTTDGYSPTYLRVKRNVPVKLILDSKDVYSCAQSFRIPSLGIVKNLQPDGEDSVTFTPVNSGRMNFSCSMGMYTGTIEVVD